MMNRRFNKEIYYKKGIYVHVSIIAVVILFTVSFSLDYIQEKYERMNLRNQSNVVDVQEYYFTPSLFENPIKKRVSTHAEDYFYFGGIEVGADVIQTIENLKESGWFRNFCERLEFGEGIDVEPSNVERDTMYTSKNDLVKVTLRVRNKQVSRVYVVIEFDVTNPSYKDFDSYSDAFLDDFMKSENIPEMTKANEERCKSLFEMQTEAYNKSGYVTNEITCLEYMDDENNIRYTFVIEHYSKENPDKARFETENIAKISYEKKLLE